eukprot:PhM_4_TR2062/c2_g1_i1/m.99980/K03006/RPB1, POLR2A; DNA-directed RNA polymerase II subunit RPB1
MAGANYPLPQLNLEHRKIAAIELVAMPKSTLQGMSVIQDKDTARRGICETQPLKNGIPQLNGTSDPRLGSFAPNVTCETCKQRYPECPGHFGHIELVEPMFNYCYFRVITMLLKTICKNCGNSLIDTTNLKYGDAVRMSKPRFRLRALSQLCRTTCMATVKPGGDGEARQGCNHVQPKVRRTEGTLAYDLIYTLEGGATETRTWYAKDILALFNKVSPDHWKFLGFNPDRNRDLRDRSQKGCHPTDFLVEVFPVPPLHVRPSVSFKGGAASEDDLTHILIQIIRYNKELRTKIEGGREHEIDLSRRALQLHIACLVNNTSTLFKERAQSRQGRAMKSIAERLKGKQGRVRQHLMGKRVEFCARTVITGDPNVEVDQVGVPRSIAMTLSFPERVTHYNRERLQKMVLRGHDVYPGANSVIMPNGDRVWTKDRKDLSKIPLNIGTIVERHMMDNDVVLFNRQPTLHRMSMMGHRVRVLPFNTFRLNLSVTTPYNADFDGDEMNLHLPQSLLTKAELIEMMMVPKNFINPGKACPVMGIVQDSLAGGLLLSKRDTFLEKHMFQNLAMWIEGWSHLPTPAVLKPRPLWTGKQIFTMALPRVSLETNDEKESPDSSSHGALMTPSDISVLIRQGELIHGTITKKHVGSSMNSLIHIIVNLEGADACKDFMISVQRITAFFLIHHSFSVGIKDSVPNEQAVKEVADLLNKADVAVAEICRNALEGDVKDRRGKTLVEAFEGAINTKLNECREGSGKKVLEKHSRNNGFKIMFRCGSKGNEMNTAQIGALVGQQNCMGKRIEFAFRRRTLPHFVRDDYGAESKGYIKNSYIKGLTPWEFFFHAMAGREGLIDTACKTADTGYIQRRIVKMTEDLHVAYDGTVRNSTNQVLQFVYGEDGLDGPKVEQKQDLSFVAWGYAKLAQEMKYEINDDGTVLPSFGGDYMAPSVRRFFRENPMCYQDLMKEYTDFVKERDQFRAGFGNEKRTDFGLAVNFQRLIRLAQQKFGLGRHGQISDLNPITVIQRVNELLTQIERYLPTYLRNNDNVWTRERLDFSLRSFRLTAHAYLNSRRVLRTWRLDKNAFEWLVGEIATRFQAALVAPGEMVGAIAAQSCGEPATQMTLNTFHHAGIASKNVTLGVPRLKEIINVTRNPKITNMTIYLRPEYAQSEKTATEALQEIEYVRLGHLVTRMEIHYDPDPMNTVIEEDQDFVREDWDMTIMDDETRERRLKMRENASRFILRLILDKRKISVLNIEPSVLAEKIRAVETRFHIEHADMNAETPCLRLRIEDESDSIKMAAAAQAEGREANLQDTVEFLRLASKDLLDTIHICGIPGIVKGFLTEDKSREVMDPVTGEFKKSSGWYIETEGTSLLRVLGMPKVDSRRTMTNKITEVFEVLGIEATMRSLPKEMLLVYSKYNVDVNHRHFLILAEMMTTRGHLTALTRQGIARTDAGPLMRATYEQQLEVLMEGAAYGELDNMRGVSANIMLGQQIRGGTGMFELHLDEVAIQDATTQENAARAQGIDNVYIDTRSSYMTRTTEVGRTPFMHETRGGVAGMSVSPSQAAVLQNVPALVSPALTVGGALATGISAASPMFQLGGLDAPHSGVASSAGRSSVYVPHTQSIAAPISPGVTPGVASTNYAPLSSAGFVMPRSPVMRSPGLATSNYVPSGASNTEISHPVGAVGVSPAFQTPQSPRYDLASNIPARNAPTSPFFSSHATQSPSANMSPAHSDRPRSTLYGPSGRQPGQGQGSHAYVPASPQYTPTGFQSTRQPGASGSVVPPHSQQYHPQTPPPPDSPNYQP